VHFCVPALADWNLLNKALNHSDDSIGTEFYTIADPKELFVYGVSVNMNPIEILSHTELFNEQIQSEPYLLDWVFHELPRPEVPEKYKRKFHFGSWIKDPSHETCLNVRGLVLTRDAQGPIFYADDKKCRITSSLWIDPYTNTQISNAEDVQIDHMVPLKNAYISGAWSWTPSQRCLYSNFMGNEFHLIPVLGTENGRKSDSTPEKYIPPRREYICKYLVNWLKIKLIWNLKLAKEEALAIADEIKNLNCDKSEFNLDINELITQRQRAVEFPDSCKR
jgi:hypothetical protein